MSIESMDHATLRERLRGSCTVDGRLDELATTFPELFGYIVNQEWANENARSVCDLVETLSMTSALVRNADVWRWVAINFGMPIDGLATMPYAEILSTVRGWCSWIKNDRRVKQGMMQMARNHNMAGFNWIVTNARSSGLGVFVDKFREAMKAVCLTGHGAQAMRTYAALRALAPLPITGGLDLMYARQDTHNLALQWAARSNDTVLIDALIAELPTFPAADPLQARSNPFGDMTRSAFVGWGLSHNNQALTAMVNPDTLDIRWVHKAAEFAIVRGNVDSVRAFYLNPIFPERMAQATKSQLVKGATKGFPQLSDEVRNAALTFLNIEVGITADLFIRECFKLPSTPPSYLRDLLIRFQVDPRVTNKLLSRMLTLACGEAVAADDYPAHIAIITYMMNEPAVNSLGLAGIANGKFKPTNATRHACAMAALSKNYSRYFEAITSSMYTSFNQAHIFKIGEAIKLKKEDIEQDISGRILYAFIRMRPSIFHIAMALKCLVSVEDGRPEILSILDKITALHLVQPIVIPHNDIIDIMTYTALDESYPWEATAKIGEFGATDLTWAVLLLGMIEVGFTARSDITADEIFRRVLSLISERRAASPVAWSTIWIEDAQSDVLPKRTVADMVLSKAAGTGNVRLLDQLNRLEEPEWNSTLGWLLAAREAAERRPEDDPYGIILDIVRLCIKKTHDIILSEWDQVLPIQVQHVRAGAALVGNDKLLELLDLVGTKSQTAGDYMQHVAPMDEVGLAACLRNASQGAHEQTLVLLLSLYGPMITMQMRIDAARMITKVVASARRPSGIGNDTSLFGFVQGFGIIPDGLRQLQYDICLSLLLGGSGISAYDANELVREADQVDPASGAPPPSERTYASLLQALDYEDDEQVRRRDPNMTTWDVYYGTLKLIAKEAETGSEDGMDDDDY